MWFSQLFLLKLGRFGSLPWGHGAITVMDVKSRRSIVRPVRAGDKGEITNSSARKLTESLGSLAGIWTIISTRRDVVAVSRTDAGQQPRAVVHHRHAF